MTTPSDAGLLSPYAYGRGYPALHPIPDPAAGATYTYTVPGGRMVSLATVHAKLVTSATVASREPRLLLADNDGIEWARIPWTTAVAASGTVVLTWARGIGTSLTGADTSALLPLPDLLLMPGHQITVDVGAIDAGDQLSELSFRWDVLPVGPAGYPTGPQPAVPPTLQ